MVDQERQNRSLTSVGGSGWFKSKGFGMHFEDPAESLDLRCERNKTF